MRIAPIPQVIFRRVGMQSHSDVPIEHKLYPAVDQGFEYFEVLFERFLPEHILSPFRLQLRESPINYTVHAPFDCMHFPRYYEDTLHFACDIRAQLVVMHLLHPLRDFIPIAVDLMEKARPLGINIALENTDLTTAGKWCSPEDLNFAFEFLNCASNIGICFDTGHANLSGTLPQEFLKRLRPDIKIFSVHFHDNDGTGDQHQSLGKGNINMGAVFDELKRRSFTGPVIIEHHRETLLDEAALVSRLLGEK